MTNEELVDLIQRDIDITSNMEWLYKKNRPIIRQIALPYAASHELDDLMQEAYFGLLEAVQRFNPEEGYKFMTYATHWIKQSISRYVQNYGRVKRLPVHIMELISKFHKFKKDYRNEHHTDPSDNDYVEALGISKQKLRALRKVMYESTCISIHDMIPGTDTVTVGDTIADDFNLEDTVCEVVDREQDKAILWGAVDELNPRCREVIKGRYQGHMPLSVIGAKEGISTERVRQIERQGILYLKKKAQIKGLALQYGYGSSMAYKGNVKKFKDTGSSSTEFLALKRVSIDEELSQLRTTVRQRVEGG